MEEERSLFYLPKALEENIQLRLPVKSIKRFESVCKQWCSLFRSKDFNEIYFGSGYHNVSIPTKRDMRMMYPELRPRGRRRCFQRRSQMWAIGPLTNGIYGLISILEKPGGWFLHTLKIGIFNPATPSLKLAAPFPAEDLSKLAGISSHKNYLSCGIDDQYRVVVLIQYDNDRPRRSECFLAFLYTWQTGEWEKLIDYRPTRYDDMGLPPLPGTDPFTRIISLLKDRVACPQKLLNGCWHWMTIQELEAPPWFRLMVLSFNFEKKLFGLIDGPPCTHSDNSDVFVMQDHLAAIVAPWDDESPMSLLQIWMKMEDSETIWTNIYSVQLVGFQRRDFTSSIFYGVAYYQVQEIKSVTLKVHGKLITFDDKGLHQEVAEEEEDSDQIPLCLAGISTFRPTLERLPDSTQGLHLDDAVGDDENNLKV